MQPKLLEEATEHLKGCDRRMAQLIEQVGPCMLKLRHEHTFSIRCCARSFTSSSRARLRRRFSPAWMGCFRVRWPLPSRSAEASEERLRSVGLSRNKMLAVKDLAAKTLDGTVPQGSVLDEMSDEEIIERVSQVRGIGRWTVEMLLIFRLGRTDVLPLDDFGVRKGFQRTYRLPDLPTKQQMLKKGEKWRPWRSIASWYLWRAAEQKSALKAKKAAKKTSKTRNAKRSRTAKKAKLKARS